MGSAGMKILLLTILSSQRDRHRKAAGPTPRGWSRPRKRTTDRGRFLTSRTDWSAFTVAGTAPDFRRLPFEPPPLDWRRWAAPWSVLLLLGLSNCGQAD